MNRATLDEYGLLVNMTRHREISSLNSALLESYANIFTLLHRSSHDPLTGLLNRQTYDDRMSRLALEMASQADSMAQQNFRKYFVIMDIDHFKQVNDKYGHLYGDEVLLHFSRLMQRSLRDSDLLFRFGGEEFVVLLNAVEGESAQGILDRFREKVATSQFPKIGRVTISLGYTALRSGDKQLKLISRADQALYHAKENGRNQCRSYESLEAPASGN